MTSLRARLLAAASVVLASFFVLTAAALDSAFRDTALQAERDKLEGVVYVLMTASHNLADGSLTIAPEKLVDHLLLHPASGLQAGLFDEQGQLVWTSAPFLEIPPPGSPAVGEWDFRQLRDSRVFLLSYGIRWIDYADDPRRYTIAVVEDSSSYSRQLGTYRRELWLWLAAAASGLLLVQFLVLRWGLLPLRRLVAELQGIERGNQAEIQTTYPDELQPLAQGLNAMIRNERSQQTRYRNALGDLAHSLKTPLAVLHGMSEEGRLPADLGPGLRDQVRVMQQITDYQLRKAAMAGRRALAEPLAPGPIAEKIVAALTKVYAGRTMRFEFAVPPTFKMRADGGDLYELLGNLLDNACKYGGGRVRIGFLSEGRVNVIRIDDDGPGFPEDAEELLERGVRADTQKPGQGIGLAAVYELVKAYEGSIELGRSDWNGGRVSVRLPA
ncbi:MAG: ATP-binding protein [Panacagrimonas sp.]